jgi:hypothetical protein
MERHLHIPSEEKRGRKGGGKTKGGRNAKGKEGKPHTHTEVYLS